MKYNNVTLGQIEALINKLGGEQGMQDFLAGRMEVVKRKFHQFGEDLLNGKGAFTVPADYNHDTQIDDFGAKTKDLKSTYYYNDALTSKNFAKATNKLVPGKTYAIKIFPILESNISSEDCLNRLKAEPGNVLVGAHGITALQSNQPDIFPKGKWTASFDEKDALWKGADGGRRVPGVGRDSDGDWLFGLGNFEDSWDSDRVLVCFCDL
ncbi:MAG: hypothetical protein LRY41_02420 [Candidatus Pacebacteria bacterium]|nr:hypothetical protein [Candidatus Paceibacterota bacterium]MCD8507948.1 hypothetical protein [Candidatus Paceibacterota bacterium]MCD8528159.1 hypothetical protein [Candidatus Paceibacterota bacterium]MCD8563645.1 hypothetical protein [Candidatus Paceibacterota bacterium]